MLDTTTLGISITFYSAIILSVVGVICNILSLLFFISSCNKGLCNHLIIALGVFDTTVCFLYATENFVSRNFVTEFSCKAYVGIYDELSALILYQTMSVCVMMAGFVTGALSIIRSLSVLCLFYMIRKRMVYMTLAVLALVSVAIISILKCGRVSDVPFLMVAVFAVLLLIIPGINILSISVKHPQQILDILVA